MPEPRGHGLRDGTRIHVVKGHPSAVETAAVIAALDALHAGAAPATRDDPWLRAARVEGARHPRVETPWDVLSDRW